MATRTNTAARTAVRPARERSSKGPMGKLSDFGERLRKVPERYMSPRLILIAVTAFLVIFGLVMIFSASSIEATSEQGDAAYYVKRQGAAALIGLGLSFLVAYVDYHTLCGDRGTLLIWCLATALLAAVMVAGSSANGATRWIPLGPIRVQPSEFAKVSLLLAAAACASGYSQEGSAGIGRFILRTAVFIGVPMVLILLEPDKGTTGIVAVMVFVVFMVGGVNMNRLIKIGICVGAIVLVFVLSDSYSRARVFSFLDPWADAYDSGYQVTQGFIGFGSGGIFGVGLGMSREKYFYLPEAHTDFIFAIIGEELGLVGTLLVVFCFALIAYEGLKIARNAPDLTGRLVATGAVTLLETQFFLNVLGVLGWFPLSGKPLPFLTYGGSSLMTSMMLVGAIVNVSIRSRLPETEHDVRRRQMSLVAEEDTGVGEAYVRGSAGSRELREGAAASRGGSVPLNRNSGPSRGLRVVDGGAARNTSGGSQGGGYTRIDLNRDDRSRLRSDSGPTVRGTDDGGRNNGRGTGRNSGRNSGRNGRRN